jgi:starch synthase
MRILMVASEVAPFSKTGGLADVVSSLPRALGRLGHAVDVVVPRYRGIAASNRIARIAVRDVGGTIHVDMYAVEDGHVRFVFVDHAPYFDREHLYGPGNDDYPDNAARFALLARAALIWGATATERYAVVHAHDWQGGLVPVLLRRETAGGALRDAAAIFTIHNLAYQGLFDASWLARLGLDKDLLTPDALEYWGRISFLKGGMLFSRIMTTVSPRYAREIETPEFGFGFEGILRSRSHDLIGILNGIDYDQWDPARDPYLPVPYDASRLDGKDAAKQQLLTLVGLPAGDEGRRRPLVGLISRMVDQKGFDLLAALVDVLPRLEASFILLGTGERRYEELWQSLAARHPERIAVRIGFDEAMAHRIEAGADLFLMPSRFEPCGLNQMYSMRYGTVPVVRATGGLADTVRDVDSATGEGTGFVFTDPTPAALLDALRRALAAHRDSRLWRRLQLAGMRQDFSWDASARQYAGVYERAYNK